MWHAEEARMSHNNAGNTAFVLVCAALVMVMTPGVAFFYGGLVRRKNFVAIMSQSFITMGVVTVVWVALGYSLTFSGDIGGFIGNLDWAGLRDVGQAPGPYSPDIPALAHFDLQGMIAILAPVLITGAFADRVTFSGYLKFLVFWTLLVYIPVAHWSRGGGFMAQWGALDFAGGLPVHVTAGFAALASVYVVGKRRFLAGERALPHSLAFVALGASLMWFGWLGFNGGSALAADGMAAQAIVNTFVSGSVAMCVWLAMTWIRDGQPRLVGALTGAIAGLVCMTPAAGYVPTWSAFIFGVLAAIAGYYAVVLKRRMGWDDALDVWAVHGVGGVLGTVLVGVFASASIGVRSADGLIAGNTGLLAIQLACAAIVTGYSLGVTYLILKVLNRLRPLRVSQSVEARGLDKEIHGEDAYDGG
jgi:Amt family ammonium transporter